MLLLSVPVGTASHHVGLKHVLCVVDLELGTEMTAVPNQSTLS